MRVVCLVSLPSVYAPSASLSSRMVPVPAGRLLPGFVGDELQASWQEAERPKAVGLWSSPARRPPRDCDPLSVELP